jgi:YD repeat-containing protein
LSRFLFFHRLIDFLINAALATLPDNSTSGTVLSVSLGLQGRTVNPSDPLGYDYGYDYDTFGSSVVATDRARPPLYRVGFPAFPQIT